MRMQQRPPETLLEGSSAIEAQLRERTSQAREIGLLPVRPRRPQAASIEVDEPDLRGAIDHDVGCVEVRVPGARDVEARDRFADARGERLVGAMIGERARERARAFDAARQQVRAIGEPAAQVTRGDRLRDRQARIGQAREQAELAECARALGAGPQVAVRDEARDEAAAPVVAQRAGADRQHDERNASATAGVRAGRVRPARRLEPVHTRHRGDIRIAQDRAARGGLNLRLDHASAKLAARGAPDARLPPVNGTKHAMDQAAQPDAAPASLCLMRTSAIGDVTHVVPMLRTLQEQWPRTQLTWIIGKLEHKLVGDLPGVEFIVFDKHAGRAGFRAVREQLAGRRFDALLHMQVALRSNILSLSVKAPLRIGYDRARSKDLHGFFINCRIPSRKGEHVLDAMASFLEPLGLAQTRVRWDLPIPESAQAFAAQHLPDGAPILLVSPVSSHRLRNWRAERYATVMDHAALTLGWRVVLCGGPSAFEREFADTILTRMQARPLDLVGKDTLKQLLALLQRADLVLCPDSGPMHMANAVGTPVLGLHAASNPERSGPYSDRQWCVDRYDAAARKFRRKPAETLAWGTKLEYPGVMDLIEVDDVLERLDSFADARTTAGTRLRSTRSS